MIYAITGRGLSIYDRIRLRKIVQLIVGTKSINFPCYCIGFLKIQKGNEVIYLLAISHTCKKSKALRQALQTIRGQIDKDVFCILESGNWAHLYGYNTRRYFSEGRLYVCAETTLASEGNKIWQDCKRKKINCQFLGEWYFLVRNSTITNVSSCWECRMRAEEGTLDVYWNKVCNETLLAKQVKKL
jgi:hypothetical protein